MDTPGVYLFPNLESLEDANWLDNIFDEDEELVLLTIDGAGLVLYQDPDVGYEMISLTPVPTSAIRKIEEF